MTREDIFLKDIRRHYDLHIFYNLYSLLQICNPDFITHILELYNEYGEEHYWAAYGKLIRQSDYFSPAKIEAIDVIITQEELQEKSAIFSKLLVEPLTQKEALRHKELRKKAHSYTINHQAGVTGHLDSILYEAIQKDKGEFYVFVTNFIKNLLRGDEIHN